MSFKNMHYSESYNAGANQVDELMISNMLNALNNPNILKMLDDEELKMILQTVKNHIVIRAKMSYEIQEAALDKGHYGTSLNDVRCSRK